MNALLAALLAASPLTVRVLERERLVAAEVIAPELQCDGAPLPSPAALTAVGNEVRAGGQQCRAVTSGRGAAVKAGELSRQYRGALRVTALDQKLAFFETAGVDEYLYGVVAAEMPKGPDAAMRAQAVVARTFAVASRGRHQKYGYDLCDLTHCQLYRGRSEERADATAAVEATKGEVLLIGGVVLAPAYFHAACGGATSAAADVFGEEGRVDRARDGCAAEWTWQVERSALARAVGARGEGAAFEPLRRDAAGRALEVRSFGARYSGVEYLALVGRAFGYGGLKSMLASAEEANGEVLFRGKGHGHGVGLCQQGALTLAEREKDYRKILRKYFPTRAVGRAP